MLVRHDTGLPGRPNTGTPSTSAKIVGFPGFSRRPSKWIRPARADDLEGEVAFANRAAARKQHHVLLQAARRTPGSAPRDRRRVRGATTGSPPWRRDRRLERRRVRVEDLPAPQPSARRDDLVAGRKNRHARPLGRHRSRSRPSADDDGESAPASAPCPRQAQSRRQRGRCRRARCAGVAQPPRRRGRDRRRGSCARP